MSGSVVRIGTPPPSAAGLSPERLRDLYRALLIPRLIEEKALLLLPMYSDKHLTA